MMKEYTDYTIEITLKSPIVTRFQSDTIFGHICWAIRFLPWSERDKLSDFLASYDNQETPPLLVSNGFPRGYLPKPIMPPITQKELEEVIGKEDRIRNSFKIKNIKKTTLIPKDDFKELQRDRITPLKLFKIMSERYENIIIPAVKEEAVVVQHNTVNRIQGKVKKGLFFQEELFYDIDSGKFEIYLRTNYFNLNDIQKIFDYIKEEGFGRDKSTGKGYFTFNIKQGIDLPEPESPNAFMTLSSYIPNEKDPFKCYYHIILKYGKLGGLYAKAIPEVNNNPFKKPLIMFSAGSTFYDKNYHNGKVYGSLLRDVHYNKNIRHYAYAFPIGINLEDKYEDI